MRSTVLALALTMACSVSGPQGAATTTTPKSAAPRPAPHPATPEKAESRDLDQEPATEAELEELAEYSAGLDGQPGVTVSKNPIVRSQSSARTEGLPVENWEAERGANSPFRAICAEGTGGADFCDVCPSFTSFEGSTNPRMSHLARGNWTGRREEALIRLVGCEPHSGNWGGTVLVRKYKVGWLAIGYIAGLLPSHCVTGSSQQVLLCFETYGFNGPTYSTGASWLDFAEMTHTSVLSSMCDNLIAIDQQLSFDGERIHLWAFEGTRDANVPENQMGCYVNYPKTGAHHLVYSLESGLPTPSKETEKLLVSDAFSKVDRLYPDTNQLWLKSLVTDEGAYLPNKDK